jgi:hypothetical protein
MSVGGVAAKNMNTGTNQLGRKEREIINLEEFRVRFDDQFLRQP